MNGWRRDGRRSWTWDSRRRDPEMPCLPPSRSRQSGAAGAPTAYGVSVERLAVMQIHESAGRSTASSDQSRGAAIDSKVSNDGFREHCAHIRLVGCSDWPPTGRARTFGWLHVDFVIQERRAAWPKRRVCKKSERLPAAKSDRRQAVLFKPCRPGVVASGRTAVSSLHKSLTQSIEDGREFRGQSLRHSAGDSPTGGFGGPPAAGSPSSEGGKYRNFGIQSRLPYAGEPGRRCEFPRRWIRLGGAANSGVGFLPGLERVHNRVHDKRRIPPNSRSQPR